MCQSRLIVVGLICLLSNSACDRSGPSRDMVLRVANWGGPSVDKKFLEMEREIREGFEARHPGVRVQIENIPGEGQYLPKLLMMFVAGKAPDVIHLDASSAAVFVVNDLVADLAPLIDADPEFDLNDYYESVVDIARRDDRLYGIPLDFTPLVMYYNKRLFDRAGVAYPRDGWTFDEFLDAARTLTVFEPGATSPSQYGLNFRNWMPGWIPWIWLNGGDVLSPDGRHAEGHFNSEATREAIRFLVKLIQEYRVAPSLSESAAMGVDLFRAERAAMEIAGHWMIIDYRADKLDFGVVSLPTNIGRPATVIYEAGLAINKQSKRRDLAWEYIKYMTGVEVQKKRVASGLAISANKHVARHYAGDPVEDAFLAAIEHARGPWGARVEAYAMVEDLGQEMVDDILFGTPVDEAIDRTARLIEAELRK